MDGDNGGYGGNFFPQDGYPRRSEQPIHARAYLEGLDLNSQTEFGEHGGASPACCALVRFLETPRSRAAVDRVAAGEVRVAVGEVHAAAAEESTPLRSLEAAAVRG